MTNKSLNVCVIGGGIFGLTIALHLSKYCKLIKVFDSNSNILNGATKYNHNRHHFGFHYPRSIETARQCLGAIKDFNKYYKNSIDYSFQNYYAISKRNSKIDYSYFEKFCNKIGLNFKEIQIPNYVFNESKISKCYLVKEGVYNFDKIKSIILKRLRDKRNIKVIKNSSIKGFVDINKTIMLRKNNRMIEEKFDLIINATYSNLNNHIYHMKNKLLMEYNLQEMCKLKIHGKRFGSTVLDGEFPSILPVAGSKNEYLFAHVKFSQLIKKVSKKIPNEILKNKYVSNLQKTFDESKKYLSVLNNSKITGNFIVIRSVNVDRQRDSRKSEIIQHENGNFSIFSGKIITVESLSKKITRIIRDNF